MIYIALPVYSEINITAKCRRRIGTGGKLKPIINFSTDPMRKLSISRSDLFKIIAVHTGRENVWISEPSGGGGGEEKLQHPFGARTPAVHPLPHYLTL
jgi:hypothetical protein